MRRDIIGALKEAIRCADPRVLMRRAIIIENERLRVNSVELNLSRFDRVFVLGGGKASAGMADQIEKTLGSRITDGLVNIPDYQEAPEAAHVRFNKASHPIPDDRGVAGVRRMLKMLRNPTNRDLVICLISGGGSALLPLPLSGIRLEDKQKTTRLLLDSGADIEEVNTVRKRLSAVKGGKLAEKLYPATILSLIISDVVGDSVSAIASGPTAPDTATSADAKAILSKYHLWEKIPGRARNAIETGLRQELEDDRPRSESKAFRSVHNVVIGSNKLPCLAAAAELRRSGYKTMILTTRLSGEAREAGGFLASILSEIRVERIPIRAPGAVVVGGETTVGLEKKGKGGRNHELVLAAAIKLRGLRNVALASIDTDGIDGQTDSAGAIAFGDTVERARRMGLDAGSFLRRHDSHTFFKKLDDLIVTGPTGTNVNDIAICVAGPGTE